VLGSWSRDLEGSAVLIGDNQAMVRNHEVSSHRIMM
jgi:hypothetical protein